MTTIPDPTKKAPSSRMQYTADPLLYGFPSKADLSEALASFIEKAQEEAISKRGKFRVAISGGSLPATLGKLAQDGRQGLLWDKWEVFLADERLVPLDHEDSNYRLIKENLLSQAGIPQDQVHPINTELLDDPEELADDYEQSLMAVFAGKNSVAFPKFDLILLGTGPDGHTCSLFPGHPLLNEDLRWIAPIEDSPKPPAKRITLTFPVLNHSHRCVFVLTGSGKQEILSKVFDNSDGDAATLPCAKVKPLNPGRVYWFTDADASGHLKRTKDQFDLSDFEAEKKE